MVSIQHIARSVFPNKRRIVIAMLTAYFDASKDKAAMTVAGLVSEVKQWERFEVKWREMLPSKVSMFHMTDFVSSQAGWESWKGKEKRHSRRRAKFIGDLVRCIRTHTRKGFAVTIQRKDYDYINAIYQLQETQGSLYAFTGIACMGALQLWADKKGIDYRDILCIFEKGDRGQAGMIKRLQAEGYNAITQAKTAIRAFDACDLIAWKARVNVDDGIVRQLQLNSPEDAKRILNSLDLIESVAQDNNMISYRPLLTICKLLHVPRRA